MNRALTDIEEVALVAAHSNGEAPAQLADAFGVARATVYNILGRHDISPDVAEDATALEAAHETIANLVDRLGEATREAGSLAATVEQYQRTVEVLVGSVDGETATLVRSQFGLT